MKDGQLSHALFAGRATGILDFIQQYRQEAGLSEAIRLASEQFVHDEPNAALQRFAEVLLLARRQALIQQQLDDDREALHHGRLSHEEHVSRGRHYETLRHQACAYNHLLRGVIESMGHYFSRDELLGWLVSASQGRRSWAVAELTGAVSEMALHAALQGMKEFRGLRYATLEEDLAGYDFVGTWQGMFITIDAKTGFYQPLAERKHGHRHLEISVPREVVKDFQVTRQGLNLLRHEVRQALHALTEGQPVAHHYYQAV